MNNSIKNILTFILSSMILLSSAIAQDKYVGCLDALNNKDYVTAIPCLREAVRKDKKNPKAYFYLGKALVEADSADAATVELIQARELDTLNVEVYLLLGEAYGKQNLHSVAIEQYKKAIELDTANCALHEKLADAYMKTRQYTDAATEYRRIIACDTSKIEMFQRLGNLLYQAKQYANALPFLFHFVTRNPDAAKERLQLVNAMYTTNRFEELIPFAQASLAVSSTDDTTKTDLLRMLAISFTRTKDYANAESTYVLLEQKDSLKAEEYLDLAKAQKALDKTDLAIASYLKAYQKDSTLGAIFYDLGSLYMNKKMYKEAAGMFEKKIATDTSAGYQYASHLNAGLCLMQVKEFIPALAHIKASIAVRPENLQAWSSLSACYAQIDDSTAQQRMANQKVIDLILAGTDSSIEKNKTKLEEAYRVEGIISFTEKRYDRSLEYLKKAYQIDNKNCQTNLLIAQCYAVQRNNDEAKKYLCKTLAICPKNEDAKKLATFIGITAADCK